MRNSRSMSLDSECKRGRSRRSNSRSVKRSPHRRRSRSRSRSRRRRDSRSNSRRRLIDRDAMYRGRQSFRDHPRASRTLGIFNLGRDFSRNELRKVFERYGRILSCNLVYDREYKESRGFGFVTFENIDDAIYAKKDANEIYIGSGERIRIDYSITEQSRVDCFKRDDRRRFAGHNPRGYNERRQSRSRSRQRYSSSRSRRRYSRSRSRGRRYRSRSHERYSRRNRYSRSRSRGRKNGRSQYSRDRSIARGRSPSPYLSKPSKSVEKEDASTGWGAKKEGSSPGWGTKKESSPARW